MVAPLTSFSVSRIKIMGTKFQNRENLEIFEESQNES